VRGGRNKANANKSSLISQSIGSLPAVQTLGQQGLVSGRRALATTSERVPWQCSDHWLCLQCSNHQMDKTKMLWSRPLHGCLNHLPVSRRLTQVAAGHENEQSALSAVNSPRFELPRIFGDLRESWARFSSCNRHDALCPMLRSEPSSALVAVMRRLAVRA